MSKDVFANHRTNTVIIIVLLALFISVIYIPKTIWDYEAKLRDESRFRMNTISLAERLHYQLVKSYTTDSEQLVKVVNGVRDSLLAAKNDSNYSYYGMQKIALAGKSISVNYTDEYMDLYKKLHRDLFKKLTPSHHTDPQTVYQILDTIKTRFNQGNFVGEQTLEIDSIPLSFNVSDKYDILYQNIKTAMFNYLTTSYTKYPEFSNPLVDAVMDSIAKNPALSGRTDFAGIYDGPVKIDFIIPSKFKESLGTTLDAYKKLFVMDSYDSSTYGDTLYDMALSEFTIVLDTLGHVPDHLNLLYTDTSGIEVMIPVEVDVRDMETAISNRRNKLYTMLTGYSEPSVYISEHVIAAAIDSMDSPNAGMDSIHLDIDLTDAVFNINIHKNISELFHKVSLEQAYYKTAVNLRDLNWDQAAIDVVESVGMALQKKSNFNKWQIIAVESDTFYVNIPDHFLRLYDNMNIALFEKLTGVPNNIHDFVYRIVSEAQHLSNVDTLDWKGAQVINIAPDTLLVDVFPTYLAEYDTTFTIARDTVVQMDDSSFNGVWFRNTLAVIQKTSFDSLKFLIPVEKSRYKYDFNGTDSVLSFNIIEKSDTARVEKVFYGMETYIMVFGDDSLMENLYQIPDMFPGSETVEPYNLSVVSDEFIAGSIEKDLFMSKDSFGGWLDTVVVQKYMKKQLYSHYNFTEAHTRCSVTDIPFRITVRNNVNLTIESPIKVPIEKRRYLFFTQIDSSHGSIADGDESWSK